MSNVVEKSRVSAAEADLIKTACVLVEEWKKYPVGHDANTESHRHSWYEWEIEPKIENLVRAVDHLDVERCI